jgi:NTP pyrophosphatase (non-canonical NTP hydrolase)
MDIKEIINRNYQATVKRGLIKPETTKTEFHIKLQEEVLELDCAIYNRLQPDENLELADVILVCLAYAKHFEIDILKVLEEKVIFNENRI